MNENYLLHNETAKSLYFEYAKDLPIIALCSDFELDKTVYNNISEAFLLNDCYKLDAMRDCRIDEKFITGDASDYEKFAAFCSVLPQFAGHPLYLLSHIELRNNFDCYLDICEKNCEYIWKHCNSVIAKGSFSDETFTKNSKISFVDVFHPMVFNEIGNSDVIDLAKFESMMLEKVAKADEKGCKISVHSAIDSFERPNPYKANEIIQKIKNNVCPLTEEYRHLEMQIIRTLGLEYKKRDWTLIWIKEDLADGINTYNNEKALEYLESNNALPRNYNLVYIDLEDDEKEIAEHIKRFSRKNILGKFVFLPGIISPASAFAHVDYIRRIICNVIGEWVENGEYTSNEKILKKLNEDILYNNLKEAIN